ncbi:MAG: DUF1576 domain-containing protein [Firmicutes bacterium]|nr:DUF1576 domain-containing protein [Bacillota bacterium]
MNNGITEKQKRNVLLFFPILLIFISFIYGDFKKTIEGLYKIIIHPDILITDYIIVGGLAAAFINSSILTLLNISLIYRLKIRINGPYIAAIFIIAGFSFFGKNIFNVWPIYLGGFLYSRYQNISFKSVALITMFGTSLSPLVSQIAYGSNISMPLSLFLGIFFGTLVGFILPPLSAHMLRTHDGYSLYNIGFTAGIIGTVIIALFRSYGFIIESQEILSKEYDNPLKILMILFSILLIILGYIFNDKSFKNYKKIFYYSGRLITDFTQLIGFGLTLINMGIMGLVGTVYVIISGGVFNGPILGGLLTIIGFAAFGKHPKNTIPILIGVLLGSLTKVWHVKSTITIIAGLFGTALAPIPGTYGTIPGIITGFIHLSVVMNIGYLHGGINLYNNGFSSGIVAAVIVPIIDAFKKED